MKNKKIAIIGTVGLPAKYGGFETLTEYLVSFLNDTYDLTIYCSSKSYDNKAESYNGAKLKYINFKANGIQSIPYDIVSIIQAIKFADTLLILGVSGCIILPFLRIFSKKRIVVNIDGLEWKREKWNWFAKKFLKYSEKLAVKYANEIVADNRIIQEHVMNEYDTKSHLIAYGGDHVTKETISKELLLEYPFLSKPFAFKVCRIEPENNIHIILQAFKESANLNIVIIGNWNANAYGQKLIKEYANSKNIFLLDPIYDQVKLNSIRSNCKVYIHGHSAGGTNPSLVEAMYLGLPVVAFGVSYNFESTYNKALYFNNANELKNLLENLDEETISSNASEMLQIAKSKYNWQKVAADYAKLF